jgi:hypothetical protein
MFEVNDVFFPYIASNIHLLFVDHYFKHVFVELSFVILL